MDSLLLRRVQTGLLVRQRIAKRILPGGLLQLAFTLSYTST